MTIRYCGRPVPEEAGRFGRPNCEGEAMEARDLLASAIEASGMSARQYAVEVLLRDERTVRRWLAGDSPIPEPVMQCLMRPSRSGTLR